MADMHNIREGMQVLGSDGGVIGTVHGLEGHQIAVRSIGDTGGTHHHIPPSWVARVDEHVHLNRTAGMARDAWTGAETHNAGAGSHTHGAGHGGAATDPPAGKSKIVWIIGAVMLLIIIVLGIRGCGYAASDPNYENQATGTLSEADRDASGAAAAVEGNTSEQ